MESMKIKFPNNELVELQYGKPVVVLGANGSGKTRISVEIERMNDPLFSANVFKDKKLEDSHIHRLSAQKSLVINTTIPILDLDSSEKILFFGNAEYFAGKNNDRFHSNPVTAMFKTDNMILH